MPRKTLLPIADNKAVAVTEPRYAMYKGGPMRTTAEHLAISREMAKHYARTNEPIEQMEEEHEDGCEETSCLKCGQCPRCHGICECQWEQFEHEAALAKRFPPPTQFEFSDDEN